LIFPNTRIAGNKNTQLLYAMHMVPNASSVIVLTKLNITGRWHGIVRQISKLTPPKLEIKKEELCPYFF